MLCSCLSRKALMWCKLALNHAYTQVQTLTLGLEPLVPGPCAPTIKALSGRLGCYDKPDKIKTDQNFLGGSILFCDFQALHAANPVANRFCLSPFTFN